MSSQIEIPCSGRPVSLGMLYNCYSDQFIQGRSPWSLEVLNKGIQSTMSKGEEVSEKLEDKNSGACKNPDEDSCTGINDSDPDINENDTHTELLILDYLGLVQYPQALKDATHVVLAIAYEQTDSTIVYTSRERDDVREEEAEKSAEAMLQNGVSQTNVNKTFDDQSLTVQGESKIKSIHKVAYLSPIAVLTNEKEQSVCLGLVERIQAITESFDAAEEQCNKLQEMDSHQKFINIKRQISTFLGLIQNFKQTFKQRIKKDKKGLENWITSVESSPFSPRHIATFLTEKEQELKTLSLHLKNAQKENIWFDFPGSSHSLDMLTADSDFKYVLCFAFQLTTNTPSYLHDMERYSMKLANTDDLVKYGLEKEQHVKQKQYNESRSKLSQFIGFAEANCESKDVAFLVKEQVNRNSTQPTILLYENGEPSEFEPPDKPEDFKATAKSSGSIELEWEPPKHGAKNVLCYRIYCSWKGMFWGEHVKTLETEDNRTRILITELPSRTDYKVVVQAKSKVGYSPKIEKYVKTPSLFFS